MNKKTAVIIGAGPAGLTAAYELLTRTDIHPIIFETSNIAGGIACTHNHNGNRIDLGGHRFFSKSPRVIKWWLSKFPLQSMDPSTYDAIKALLNHALNGSDKIDLNSALNPEIAERVMLVRKRLSRIFFKNRFYDYPISLNLQTIKNLGFIKVMRIGFSYFNARLFPRKHENSLEDFFINRFGYEMYNTFFKDYTEKVWGIECKKIKPEWGAQRIKGLSIAKVITHALTNILFSKFREKLKNTETSLIDFFLYPKFGPGQLWESIANVVQKKGGEIKYQHTAIALECDENNISTIIVKNNKTSEISSIRTDYVFSTMPVRDLIAGMRNPVPNQVKHTAQNLQYRDFITVGLLFNNLKTPSGTIPDNWIYIQEPGIKVGRIQIFNNWSPYLVKDLKKIWMGLEYFCQEGDEIWNLSDEELINLGKLELQKINFADSNKCLDGVVIRTPKAYPAYFGSYESFHLIRSFIDKIENLFLIGRNGMHRYNNMDHSMLTAMTAVDNIISNIKSKDNLWSINTESEYHEKK